MTLLRAKKMRYPAIATILIGALLLANPTRADDGISVIELARGSVGLNGAPFRYPDGKPEITVKKFVINPREGEKVTLAEHCHPNPAGVYIRKGGLTVTDASGSWTFREGDGIIDIMNVWHDAEFSEPTELIVFYAGAVDMPLSVKKGSDSELVKRCSHGLAGNL